MKLRVIILLAIAGLVACHRNRGSAPALPAKAKTAVETAVPNQLNPQQLTAGMVEAVPQGKAQAPVDLKFDLPARPLQGQSFEVAIALLPQITARSATVAVIGSDGLKVEAGGEQFEFPAIEAAQVYRHSIKVTPASEGLYLLTLSVSLQHDQASDSRVFSVPILVGSGTGSGSSSGEAGAPQPAGGHQGS